MTPPPITPGPWTVIPYGDERNMNLVIHHSPQGRVCFMATPGQNRAVEEAQIEANATAIAAVPAMIEALLIVARSDGPDRVSLYDEEGVEGWGWRDQETGREWHVIGAWDEDPPPHPIIEEALKLAGVEPCPMK